MPPAKRAAESAGVAALALLWLAVAAAVLGYTADDALILFRHVRNHAEGRGMVWDEWHPVMGHSSAAWAWLLRGASALGFEVIPAARAMGLVLTALAVGGLYAIARRALGARAAALLAALVAAFPPLVLWAGAGLEGPLALAVSVAFAAALGSDALQPRTRAALLAALAFASPFIRPDLPLQLFAAAAAFAVVRRDVKGGAAVLGGAAAGVAAGLLLCKAAYGEWVPLPVLVKSHVGPRNVLRFAGYVLKHGPELLVAGAAVGALLWRGRRGVLKDPMAVAALALLVAIGGELSLLGGDELARGRFLVVPAACMAMLAARLAQFAPRLPASAAAGLVALAALAGGYRSLRFEDDARCSAWRERAGLWLRDHTATGFSIALLPAGFIPYYSERPALDLYGLAHPRIARLRGPRRGSRDWGRAAMAIGDDEQVCAAVLASCAAELPGPGGHPVIAGIADMLKERGGYALARAELEGGTPLWLAVHDRCKGQLRGEVAWAPLSALGTSW
jgi:hypothetical protein